MGVQGNGGENDSTEEGGRGCGVMDPQWAQT